VNTATAVINGDAYGYGYDGTWMIIVPVEARTYTSVWH